jgi:putative nucleotidyltransferase with HDIG domain
VNLLDETGHHWFQSRGRDLGLILVCSVGVALAHLAMSASLPVATTVVLAVSTAAVMHTRLAVGRWGAALQIALAGALLIAAGAPPRLVGTVVISGMGASELIARGTRRTDVLQAGLWTAVLASGVSISGVAATVALPDSVTFREALGALVGGFVGAPVMLALGPAGEWLFGHSTRLTMSEWLSYESPLLRELSSVAPGTFQHSINVGVLADAAARAIGADALLSRVGGLYHDVGKTRAPQYFIENQHGPNPHDDLAPWESARILRAHVLDGVTLVRAHGMGDRIADFVREHHGTGTMRLLRDRAEALGGSGSDEETYRYPGPMPRSRETGLVMIADQLEATARSAPPADDAGFDAMVGLTIGRIEEGRELDGSGLTARDLSAVRPALSRALQAMYHRRMTYPPSGEAERRDRLTLVPRIFGRRRAAS